MLIPQYSSVISLWKMLQHDKNASEELILEIVFDRQMHSLWKIGKNLTMLYQCIFLNLVKSQEKLYNNDKKKKLLLCSFLYSCKSTEYMGLYLWALWPRDNLVNLPVRSCAIGLSIIQVEGRQIAIFKKSPDIILTIIYKQCQI